MYSKNVYLCFKYCIYVMDVPSNRIIFNIKNKDVLSCEGQSFLAAIFKRGNFGKTASARDFSLIN